MLSVREKAIEECTSHLGCSASMCPLDPPLKEVCWYPEEKICRRNFPPDWVKIQKKIKKKTRSLNTYYTFEMLNRNCIVKGGMVGLDADRPEEAQLKSWLRRHKAKRVLTDKERDILRERFKKSLL
jgi:hypothetical protein